VVSKPEGMAGETVTARGSVSGVAALASGSVTVTSHFMFDTEAGTWDVAVSLVIDTPPLYINVVASTAGGRCKPEGTEVSGTVRYDDPAVVQLSGAASGVSFCEYPDNVNADRYFLNFTMDELTFVEGAISVTDVVVVAVGKGKADSKLSELAWSLTAKGHIVASTATSENAVTATGEVSMTAAYDPREGVSKLESLEVTAAMSGSLGGGAFTFSAAASYEYPCAKELTARADVRLKLEGQVDAPLTAAGPYTSPTSVQLSLSRFFVWITVLSLKPPNSSSETSA